MPVNNKKTVNLYSLKKSKKWLQPLRQFAFDRLGDSLYEITDKQEFVFQIMSGMYPLNRSLTNELDSIEKACQKFFLIFKIKKGYLITYTDKGVWEKDISKEAPKDPIDEFLNTYLQLEISPGAAYKEIYPQVKQDLQELNNLIKWYETQPYIQSLINKNAQPRNHEERILFDFYNRCMIEQNTILSYYLNDIKKRAIVKAGYWGGGLSTWLKTSARFYDRPYRYARMFSYPFFDCRKIDLTSHRLLNYGYDQESLKLERIYSTNKSAFYKTIFKKNKPQQIFQDFDFYLSQLPLKDDRRPIFEELKKLFNTKRWIAFYSLALTQIEGFFSEMYLITNPNSQSGSNKKALPDKVNFVRPFHELSDYYFDYYQYHIPRLRNKFMHSGYDEDFKLKSFDLLIDLHYILKLFSELKDPLIKIKRLHVRREMLDFATFNEFGEYFSLLTQLSAAKRIEIKHEIDLFVNDFLLNDCGFEFSYIEVMQQLKNHAKEFVIDLNDSLSKKGKLFELANANKSDIQALLNNEQYAEILKERLIIKRDVLENLSACYYFITGAKTYLTMLSAEYIKLNNDLLKQWEPLLKKIITISNQKH